MAQHERSHKMPGGKTRTQRTRTRKQNGQGLLEFALITPVLLLVFFIIIDSGWMFFNYSQLYNANREGTRWASVTGFSGTDQTTNCSGIMNVVVSNGGFSGISANNTFINIWYDDGRGVADNVLGNSGSPIPASVVAYCNGTTFTANTVPLNAAGTYVCQTGSSCPTRPDPNSPYTLVPLLNGDRVAIDVVANIKFLTPFDSAIVPQGIPMHLRNYRSVFPGGLAS